MTSHVARFPDTESSSATGTTPANHRGVMLSMLCAFHTRRQIDEWSKSIAEKYSRVDFLINFVDEDEKKKSGSTIQEQQQLDPQSSEPQQQHQGEDSGSSGGFLGSSAYVAGKSVIVACSMYCTVVSNNVVTHWKMVVPNFQESTAGALSVHLAALLPVKRLGIDHQHHDTVGRGVSHFWEF